MHFDDLQVFLSVAKHLSFTQASERLNMPKASVSRAVARLEEALGHRLLERSTRRLRLTDAGTQLVDQSAPLAERLAEVLRQSALQRDRPQGVLRIAAPYELGVFRVGDVLTRLLAQYPGLEAEVELTSDARDPRVDDYDIVLRLQQPPLEDSSLVARRIYSVARALYAAPALIARLGMPRSPADLAGMPAILSPDEPVWQLQGHDGQVSEIRPAGRLRAGNVGMRLRGVAAGLGVGVLSSHYCRDMIASGEIVQILPDCRIAPMRVYALLPGRRLMPAKVRVFLDALQTALAPWDQENPAGRYRADAD